MKIDIDKRVLQGGSILEITWDNSSGRNQSLVVHTGSREAVMDIPPVGSKKLRMRGGSLWNWVAIRTEEYGKVYTNRRYFIVLGKQKETDDFEYVGANPVKDRMKVWKDAFLRKWSLIPKEKQPLHIILIGMCIHQFLEYRQPSLALMLETAIFFYIIYILYWKR